MREISVKPKGWAEDFGAHRIMQCQKECVFVLSIDNSDGKTHQDIEISF